MKFVPAKVSRGFFRVALKTQKASPHILFGAGLVGMVGTVVLASMETLQLEETLEQHNADLALAKAMAPDPKFPDYTAEDENHDIIVLRTRAAISIARLYAPAFVLGAASVAALTGAHVIMNRRNAALTVAYVALQKGYDEYRKRVSNALGEDREEELRYDIAKREVTDAETGKVKKVSAPGPMGASIYARFFDESSVNWTNDPGYNKMFLQAQQNYANDRLISRGHLFLNEVYEMLGIPHSQAGSVTGWLYDGPDGFVDFGVFNGLRPAVREFVNGQESSILLDFNVDGVIYNKI